MQASTYGSVKGNSVFGVQQQRRVLGFGEPRRTSAGLRNLCMTDRSAGCGGLRLTSAAMGAKLARLGMGFDGISMASLKARSVKAQASGLLITVLKLAWLLNLRFFNLLVK